ncbi:D-hexose-6-phosphate mutarotase [Propionivibrio limicola]|uniref:D-hexose-6-phosphate mutarotase n=1 Tax=Propionivibrio limicola TaxID=167645 RepID=UPI0012920993|nr:D-hexose-6-phosphate mutarotase [Propionivibrio limicola]
MTNTLITPRLAEAAGVRQQNSRELYPSQHAADDAGLPMLVIDNPHARAVISLQGGQLMAFRPARERELLWVSPCCAFKPGKALRGGIPLCLPWFGPTADGQGPQHGFARTSHWSLVDATVTDHRETHITLELASDTPLCAQWPVPFVFRLDIVVGRTLSLRLAATNRGQQAVPLSFAFHTYFAVPNVADARTSGLDGLTFIDKMDRAARKRQQGDVVITSETDRVYLDAPSPVILHSAPGPVTIEADTRDVIVWNAWTNDRNIADLGAGNHQGYLCVECGNVGEHAEILPAGGTFAAQMSLSL